MITKLNLASHPFRNRTIPYLLSMFLVVCAFVGLIYSFAKWRDTRAKSEVVKQESEKMSQDLADLNEKGELVKENLTPEQERLMIAGHKVIANKEFGWSLLLSDIERVLPGNVSASRINVENIYKESDETIKAEIEFAVLSRNYQGVQQMMQNMNNSGVFRASLRGQDLRKGEVVSFTEYTLALLYQPRNSVSVNPPSVETAANEKNDETGEEIDGK